MKIKQLTKDEKLAALTKHLDGYREPVMVADLIDVSHDGNVEELLKAHPELFRAVPDRDGIVGWSLTKDVQNKIIQGTSIAEPDSESVKILQDPDLFNIIDSEFDKQIVGEHETRKTIFLVSCSRSVLNAHPTSGNLLVNDAAGIGKDWVVSHVLRIWPEGIIQHKKRISEMVFTYWHNATFEPEWSWDDKIFYGEDTPNNVLNSDPFKLMASSDRGVLNTSTIVIKQKAVEIGIRGKPCIFLTMATSNPKNENLRRFPTIECNESKDQTREIVRRIAKLRKRGINPEYDVRLTKALSYLKPVKVSIPFAEGLAESVVCDDIIMRTNFSRFLDYISFSAALHQFQRDTDENGNVIATKQDYEIAGESIKRITSNERSIPMTKKQREIIKIMKGLALIPYSVKELSSHIQIIGERQLYRELDRMAELGFVKRDNDIRYSSVDQEGNPYGTKHEITTYLLQTQGEFKLPSWEDIEKYVKAVNDVNDVNDVKVVNQQTEPLIKKRGKKLIDKIVNIDNDKSYKK